MPPGVGYAGNWFPSVGPAPTQTQYPIPSEFLGAGTFAPPAPSGLMLALQDPRILGLLAGTGAAIGGNTTGGQIAATAQQSMQAPILNQMLAGQNRGFAQGIDVGSILAGQPIGQPGTQPTAGAGQGVPQPQNPTRASSSPRPTGTGADSSIWLGMGLPPQLALAAHQFSAAKAQAAAQQPLRDALTLSQIQANVARAGALGRQEPQVVKGPDGFYRIDPGATQAVKIPGLNIQPEGKQQLVKGWDDNGRYGTILVTTNPDGSISTQLAVPDTAPADPLLDRADKIVQEGLSTYRAVTQGGVFTFNTDADRIAFYNSTARRLQVLLANTPRGSLAYQLIDRQINQYLGQAQALTVGGKKQGATQAVEQPALPNTPTFDKLTEDTNALIDTWKVQ